MGLRWPPSGFTDRTAAVGGVRYASWVRRLGAFLIDYLILLTIGYVLGAVLSFAPSTLFSTIGRHPSLVAAIEYFFLLGGVGAVYATLCLDKLHGQTPGMSALRIRCVPTKRHGRLTLAQCLLRAISASVLVNGLLFAEGQGWRFSFLAVPALFALYLWPVIDGRRQTLWDHLARTVVLDDRY